MRIKIVKCDDSMGGIGRAESGIFAELALFSKKVNSWTPVMTYSEVP